MATGRPWIGVLVAAVLSVSVAASAQSPSGETVYQKRCATCHEQTNPRIPARTALQKMPATRIVRALDSGAMMAVAFTMSRDERLAVASYLGTNEVASGPPPAAFCRDRAIRLSSTPSIAWNGWSPGTSNARFQAADAARLTIDQVARLRLKWAFGFDGDVAAFAQPTVLDGQVFVGSAGGVVHAMRADSGCLEWTFQANGPVRAAMLAVPSNGSHTLLFGDMTGWFYALDAATGKLRWKVHLDTHDSTRLTAAPAASGGIVYVPISSWEETRSSDPDYPCCSFRGSVVALRVSDGKQVWKTYLVDPAKERGRTARGVPRLGPSGVGVWSTPTLDLKRGLLYVTTGDNYSSPATELSDAVVALDLSTGRISWSRQVTKDDVFNGHCAGADRVNCPATMGPDFDFGSSAILTALPDGSDLLLAGQKSGIVWALDPARRGEIVWQSRVGKGGTGGGIQWGMSSDGQNVYAAVADPVRTRQNDPLDPRRYAVDPGEGGGLTALRIGDGSTLWHAPSPPCAAGAPAGCGPAQPAAVTSIPGVVFAASNDGHLRAYASSEGKVLWDVDTMRDIETVNGVKARGGSIDGPGAVVVGGMVFVTSGYPRNGGVPGNVLLAFAP
jgi:polyvinyl alcohol dehydrogenase (cytochrome)